MNARQLVAVLSTLVIMVNGAGFVRAGSAQPVAPPTPSASQAPQVTPSRLSYVDGDVSFWRPGAQDWAPARLNTALAPGDVLYTAQRANVEIQIGPRAFVRAAEGTQIGVDNQEPDYVQLRMTAGHAALDLRELPAGYTVELDTPNAAFTVARAGYYHVEVAGDSVGFGTHRGGSAIVTPANGSATPIAANQQAIVVGTDAPRVEFAPAPPLTAWDNWNYQRSAALLQPRTATYVSSGIYGTPELDRYGTWREVDPYGPIWVPSAIAASWTPYSTGRWIWDPIYGWTWLDDAPWGWAPYHYGRWVFVGRSWAWAPGPVVVRPVYAPALVAFFGGGVTVSVGRPLAWAPLGWGEPLIPWWGRSGFVGVPTWRGWGGPRVVNNVVINNTTVVNAQNITVYRNVNEVNAVVGVPAERFGRDRVAPGRLSQNDVRQLTPIRGPLSVRPVATSVMPATAAAPKPPESIQQRRIVSTRPPLDVAPILRAQGLSENSDASRRMAPRLVPSPKSTTTAVPAASPPTMQESRPALRDVPTSGRAVQRPADDGVRPSSPTPPKIVTPPQQERPRGDAEPPRADRERRAVQTPPPPPVGPSREAAPPNSARPEAPPARVERPAPIEPPARRPERAEPPARAERAGDQRNESPPPQAAPAAREASPPSRPQPEPPAPRVERPARVEPPAPHVERPARVEPPAPRVERPARVESPAPRVERPGRVDAQGNASPALPRPTPPPQPAPTREAPPPSARRPEAPPARVERQAPPEPPARQRPERAEAPKRAERSGEGAPPRQQ